VLGLLLLLLLLLLPADAQAFLQAVSLCSRISSGDIALSCFLICARIAFLASKTELCSAATVVTGACIVLHCK
jgi:hypothetical protein